MKTFVFLFVFFVLGMTPALAQKKVAIVKLIRGDVELLSLGKASKLKVDEWVKEGEVIKTSDKSFVKLVFIDKSQMNIGPKSEMKIEQFSGKDSGIMDLVKGKIRSQVSKDYLQIDKGKSKLFIKTSNAVMGVRGTDFTIASNGKTTSVVLFEGEVVFNKLDKRELRPEALERIVDQGVRLIPGEFSVVEHKREPTVPAILNPHQREKMERNHNFDDKGDKEHKVKEHKSVVPEGLSGDVVSSDSATLKKEVLEPHHKVERGAPSDPAGFVHGDKVKPANGSFLHVESGIIVPPAPDSVLDKNTNTYVSGSGNGTVAPTGDYVPPKNIEISNDGKMIVTVQDDHGKVKHQEIERPMPVRHAEDASMKLSEVKRPEEMRQFNHQIHPDVVMDKGPPRDFHDRNMHDPSRMNKDIMMQNRMEGIKDRMGMMPPPPPPPTSTTDYYKPPTTTETAPPPSTTVSPSGTVGR